MPLKLPGRANEKSSVGVEWTFLKADGTAPEITAMTWTLSDLSGNVINSRSAVAVTDPGSPETIVLSGDDLAIVDATQEYEMRILTIEATYDPENGGSDLPIKESAEFAVYNLQVIS
jgi:hypothetical protein